MKHLRVVLLAFIALILVIPVYGQRGLKKQANKYFKAEKYLEAIEYYEQIRKIDKNKELLYNRGVSYLMANRLDDAVKDFMASYELGNDRKEIFLNTAKALHKKGNYKDASQFYKNYLQLVDDKEEEHATVEAIKKCKYAYNNQYNDQLGFVENLGESVNTEYDELYPIQSPTSQKKYYFSSNRNGSNGGLRNKKGFKDEIFGKYSADMYAVELNDGNWTAVSAFYPLLNSPKNDYIQGFNSDGTVLYFLKTSDGMAGQMYADTFAIDKDPEALPKVMTSPVLANLGDKDIQIFNKNLLLFSSKRAGGYGGYDLYICMRKDGQWSAPKNLGPNINTPYNETSPFLAKSGTKLYFTSDNVNGFGGTDIFTAIYDVYSSSWSPPVNVGIPINSPANERDFSISSDGMSGVFSSDRVGSLGGYDIFLAYFKDQVVDQMLYTETVPFLDIPEIDTTASKVSETTTPIVQKNEITEPITKKEFFSKPLFYSKDEVIVTPGNKTKLNAIKDLMIVYPELEVTLSGHSVQEGMREFDLYFSIKRAEKAAQYLIDHGIESSRIKVRGLGSNFPHAKNSAVNLADRNNRRIDISFTKVPKQRLEIINELPTISESFLDGSTEKYYNKLKGLSYKIEVAKTKQMYKADIIRQYPSGSVTKAFTDTDYTYSIGLYNKYNEAKKIKSQLIRQGANNVHIRAYMNDDVLSRDEINSLKDVYPDLGEFLKFEK